MVLCRVWSCIEPSNNLAPPGRQLFELAVINGLVARSRGFGHGLDMALTEYSRLSKPTRHSVTKSRFCRRSGSKDALISFCARLRLIRFNPRMSGLSPPHLPNGGIGGIFGHQHILEGELFRIVAAHADDRCWPRAAR